MQSETNCINIQFEYGLDDAGNQIGDDLYFERRCLETLDHPSLAFTFVKRNINVILFSEATILFQPSSPLPDRGSVSLAVKWNQIPTPSGVSFIRLDLSVKSTSGLVVYRSMRSFPAFLSTSHLMNELKESIIG